MLHIFYFQTTKVLFFNSKLLEKNSFFSGWEIGPNSWQGSVLYSHDFIFQLRRFFFFVPLNSWALLHLTMVKLVLHNVKNFFPIAGLEFSGKFGIWKLMLLSTTNYHQVSLYKIHIKEHLVLKKYSIGDVMRSYLS